MNTHGTQLTLDTTIHDALEALDALSGTKSLIVTDNEGRMTGALTDGDIRRGLLAGSRLDDPVSQVCHRGFTALHTGDDTVSVIGRCRRLGIRLLPVLDDDGRVIHIYDLDRLDTVVPLRALLMAGGRGERLRPLTDTTPKPLLPVGSQPIIDRNIELLRRAGIRDITVSTRYMHERFVEHFDGSHDITLMREEAPLGTIGALASLPRTDTDILLMNADLLTRFSIENMYLTHVDSNADITIGTVPYTVSIPYAIIDADITGRVAALTEKPTHTYAANAGIYIISHRIQQTMAHGERIDAPDLITRVIERGGVVRTYPLDGSWLDIGTPTDYERANTLVR